MLECISKAYSIRTCIVSYVYVLYNIPASLCIRRPKSLYICKLISAFVNKMFMTFPYSVSYYQIASVRVGRGGVVEGAVALHCGCLDMWMSIWMESMSTENGWPTTRANWIQPAHNITWIAFLLHPILWEILIVNAYTHFGNTKLKTHSNVRSLLASRQLCRFARQVGTQNERILYGPEPCSNMAFDRIIKFHGSIHETTLFWGNMYRLYEELYGVAVCVCICVFLCAPFFPRLSFYYIRSHGPSIAFA